MMKGGIVLEIKTIYAKKLTTPPPKRPALTPAAPPALFGANAAAGLNWFGAHLLLKV